MSELAYGLSGSLGPFQVCISTSCFSPLITWVCYRLIALSILSVSGGGEVDSWALVLVSVLSSGRYEAVVLHSWTVAFRHALCSSVFEPFAMKLSRCACQLAFQVLHISKRSVSLLKKILIVGWCDLLSDLHGVSAGWPNRGSSRYIMTLEDPLRMVGLMCSRNSLGTWRF